MRRAMELQQQISAMGIPVFVRACAAAAGDEIPQDAYDSFSMEDMLSAAQTLAEQAQQEPAEAEEKPEENTQTPTPASTPSRCFWTALRWTTGWCSTSSRC